MIFPKRTGHLSRNVPSQLTTKTVESFQHDQRKRSYWWVKDN